MRECHFEDDSHGRQEQYWYCVVHHTRTSSAMKPCYFSRYDGTVYQLCPKGSPDCPRQAHSHASPVRQDEHNNLIFEKYEAERLRKKAEKEAKQAEKEARRQAKEAKAEKKLATAKKKISGG